MELPAEFFGEGHGAMRARSVCDRRFATMIIPQADSITSASVASWRPFLKANADFTKIAFQCLAKRHYGRRRIPTS